MEFINYTPFTPMTFESLDIDDNQFQVVILKGTFNIIPDAPLRPHPDQMPITPADEFYGEIGKSSVRFEDDLAPYKPRTDIIINATAYPPGGKPSPSWVVSAKIGNLQKHLVVTGPRYWKHTLLNGWVVGEPEPCTAVPIRYEHAFGGYWEHEDESGVCEENPVGLGFVNQKYLTKKVPIPAPRIMSPDDLVLELGKKYKPQGFSAIHKSWLPRRQLGGTYDEKWVKERHPMLPKDFDHTFYNCGHPDMIYNGYLKGDESIFLKYLHAEHETLFFKLPNYKIGLVLRFEDGSLATTNTVLDTLYIDMISNFAFLVWRGLVSLEDEVRVIEARMTLSEKQPMEVKHGR